MAQQELSHAHYVRGIEEQLSALKSDIASYEIEEVEEVGPYLVMKVKYLHPDGKAREGCTFEGSKVMVFEATVLDALKWRAIDPHFAEPGTVTKGRQAPAPIARFPGSLSDGFSDALAFAAMKAAAMEAGSGGE